MSYYNYVLVTGNGCTTDVNFYSNKQVEIVVTRVKSLSEVSYSNFVWYVWESLWNPRQQLNDFPERESAY